MKSRALLFLLPIVAAFQTADAATVYAFWSGQDTANSTVGTPGAASSSVISTFPTSPTLNRAAVNPIVAGGATFTDFQGTTWTGSGGTVIPGYCFGWNAGTGTNSMTLGFNLTGLEDMTFRMDIRSAGTGALTAFSAIEYDTGSGFTNVGVGSLNFGGAVGSFGEYTLNLSSLAAIEGQSNVQVRFTLGNVPTGSSIRIDNIQVAAQTIPEPASVGLLALGSGLLIVRRRK